MEPLITNPRLITELFATINCGDIEALMEDAGMNWLYGSNGPHTVYLIHRDDVKEAVDQDAPIVRELRAIFDAHPNDSYIHLEAS